MPVSQDRKTESEKRRESQKKAREEKENKAELAKKQREAFARQRQEAAQARRSAIGSVRGSVGIPANINPRAPRPIANARGSRPLSRPMALLHILNRTFRPITADAFLQPMAVALLKRTRIRKLVYKKKKPGLRR